MAIFTWIFFSVHSENFPFFFAPPAKKAMKNKVSMRNGGMSMSKMMKDDDVPTIVTSVCNALYIISEVMMANVSEHYYYYCTSLCQHIYFHCKEQCQH